ncbi:stage V sporulation protein R [Haladaptatus litoreus]|uniref:Stage V sporulation protein R n=1 Tax=Haladaptatus litoreus TaxID=553468 RepID=A0A1N6Z0C6_9EURY|nr:SpoVR family protein [Haladaptatus litoreus]SIR20235.1 stage V sporulation protein R [Haladaptatus litoreus]
MNERIETKREAERVREPVVEARKLAKKLGLDPYPVKYWIIDYDEMNELIAYDGFQERYPHWRWGMKYDRQQKQTQYAGGKAFEIVINDDPAHAFLQQSNSLADQKAVITHVEAHSDFFANNRWYRMFADELDAAALLSRHADRVRSIMADSEIDREAVEKWIDNVLCLQDNIDQHQAFKNQHRVRDDEDDHDTDEISDQLADMNLSDEVRDEVFDDEWLEAQREKQAGKLEEPEKDLLAFFRDHGRAYDPEEGKAVEMEDWQKEVLEMLRTESYYFAAQKTTKVMNEGWAAYWESMMMGEESFAGTDEFIEYADHQARVLGSPGLNPYKLGKQLWEYIENTENRREVVRKLMRVKGITWRNFHDVVDFDEVNELIEPHPALESVTSETLSDLESLPSEKVDSEGLERAKAGEIDVDRHPWKVLSYEGLAERHFSLNKLQNRGFLESIGQQTLEQYARYLMDDERYETVAEAMADVDFAVGWNRMYEVRASHNDVTFLDGFLTKEFVTDNNYFTYEFSQTTGDYRVTSSEYEDVKKKLMLQFTNFGKPTIAVYDGNYDNRNELLLGHHYNGVMLDIGQATRTLERIYDLWGRPVNLKTIVKEIDERDAEIARRRDREPEPEEKGKLLRYDGNEFEMHDLPWSEVEDITATEVDYDTKPDEWLA